MRQILKVFWVSMVLAVLSFGLYQAGVRRPAMVDGGRQEMGGIVSLSLCADGWLFYAMQRDLGLASQGVRFSYLAADEAVSMVAGQFDASIRQRLMRPDLEKIMLLKPALVVLDGFGHSALHGQLRRMGVPVMVMPYAETLADALSHAEVLWEKVGIRKDQREAWLQPWRATLQAPIPEGEEWLMMQEGGGEISSFAQEYLLRHGMRVERTSLGLEALLLRPDAKLLRLHYAASASRSAERLQHPALEQRAAAVLDKPAKIFLCPGPWLFEEEMR
jgi:hypothetical protein